MIVQLGAFDPNKDYSGKYMLAFYFKQEFGIPFCHCTHKYLGEISREKLDEVSHLVDEYFAERKRDLVYEQRWWFDHFTHLGPDAVPVLERRNTAGMLLDLKGLLDALVPEKWPSYRPHIAVPEGFQFVRLPMDPVSYKLMEGGKMLKEWAMARGF